MPHPTPTARWAGLALTVLVTLFLLADGLVGLLTPQTLAAEMAATGWPAWSAGVVGVIAVTCALLFAWPATGPQALAMIDIDRPTIDWVAMARSMGVPGVQVDTVDGFTAALLRAAREPGPSLIEVKLY